MSIDRDDAITNLGLDARATREDIAAAIDKGIEDTAGYFDPGVLEIFANDARKRITEKLKTEGIESLFAPNAGDAIAAAEREKWQKLGREKFAAMEAAWTATRQELDRSMDTQRQLGGEADQPNGSRQERLLAKLVDLLGEAEADRWLDERTPDEALARYTSSTDDGPERPFVRVVERRVLAGVLPLAAARDPLGAAQQFNEAVQARRDARIRPLDVETSKRLTTQRNNLDRLGVVVNPSSERARARAIGAAGTPGGLKNGVGR